MKSIVVKWLVTNVFELSTWIGLIMFVREFFAYNPSTIMLGLALVLIFVSDAKLNDFIQRKMPGLKKWLENL